MSLAVVRRHILPRPRVILGVVLLCAWACRLGAADAPHLGVLAGSDGSLRLSLGDRDLGAFLPGAADAGWSFAAATPITGDGTGTDHGRPYRIAIAGTHLDGLATATASGDGIDARWTFTPTVPVRLNSIHVTGEFAVRTLAGGTWTLDQRSGIFPAQLDQPGLADGLARSLTLTTATGTRLSITCARPTHILLQDNRRWGSDTFSVRIGPGQGLYPAAAPVDIAFTLTSPGGVTYAIDHPVTITAGADWIPLHQEDVAIEAGSALDWSGLVERVAPCGRLGRVVATADGHFAFAQDPHTPRRFYGANLCFTAQYLSHADADRFVERFARLGYNAIRIHHYDGLLVGGRRGPPQLEPGALDQLDYLLAACGRHGIYATTDLYVSRPIGPEQLGLPPGTPVNPKMWVPVLPAAFDDWKAFAVALLGHVNPYTRLRWADDPTLAWIAMINEGNLENFWHDIRGAAAWTSAWNTWLVATYHDRSALAHAWGGTLEPHEDPASGTVALPSDLQRPDLRARDGARFVAATERTLFERMRSEVLDQTLHCHALLSNASAWTNRASSQAARCRYDYDDDHFYVDHPAFLAHPWSLPSRIEDRDPLCDGAPGGTACAFTGLADRPMTITEFNYAAPSRYRAIGGLLTGALAALQDWSGVWRFAYAHDRAIIQGPHPLDYFDVGADVLNQASERAALALFLRGDARVAPHRVALVIRPADIAAAAGPIPLLAPRWTWTAWVAGMRTAYQDPSQPLPPGFAALPMAGIPSDTGAYALDDPAVLAWLGAHGIPTTGVDPKRHRLCSETGEIRILGDEERLVIDTPRTAGGFARPGGSIDAAHAGLHVEPLGVPATVFACALDGQPLRASRRILVTHLTELLDEGTTFAETARRTLTAWGRLPHLVRAGRAQITLAVEQPARAHVWTLAVSGHRVAPVATTVTDGAVTFTAEVAGPDGARMLYEIAQDDR